MHEPALLTNPALSPRGRLDGLTPSSGLALAGSLDCCRCPSRLAGPGLDSTTSEGPHEPFHPPESAAFVGIDWADRQPEVCLQGAGCDTRECSVLSHRPECRHPWAQALRQRFEGRPIAVCLERSQGPRVSALQPYDFLVRFPVNPTTLATYRDAFCRSHAKDDPTDAELALARLRAPRDRLTARSRKALSGAPCSSGGAAPHPGGGQGVPHESAHRRAHAVLPPGLGVVQEQGHRGRL